MAFTNTVPKYVNVLAQEMKFGVGLKVLPTEGNLVYEYNPFRNYRLTLTAYLYRNTLFTPRELLKELLIDTIITADGEVEIDTATNELCLYYIENKIGKDDQGNIKDNPWQGIVPSSETDPVLVEAGELTDFETDELSFDINHPVNILPLYSYDNSVNLIINDGKNTPRLINSRFSATNRNKYLIVDRKGNNDTNIYDLGSQFDIDTSLYKRVIEIPRLKFYGTNAGGKLSIGNYHFYFRYSDADGNETDFVAESGLVSVFIGHDPGSIRSGFRNEDSHKAVRFVLSNIDSAYQYVNVYYTRATSDIHLNRTASAYKVLQKYLVNNASKCDIIITGYEETEELPLESINPFYLTADSAETLVSCLNMLFLGNITRPDIPYTELQDLSLRFLPSIHKSDYDLNIDKDYNIYSTSLGYYDSKYIYNKVGYWNHEYYRFGIVYIMSDNSLSPVFNIRGIENLSDNIEIYSDIPMWKDDNDHALGRNYIIVDEESLKIVADTESYGNVSITGSSHSFENAKGVISINTEVDNGKLNVYGIKISTTREVINYLANVLKIKGFFYVRLKRIPTILCLAYTIGVDPESRTPILPIEKGYIAERFITDKKEITHDFKSRLYKFKNNGFIRKEAAICPEYDVDPAYYNTLFCGDSYSVCESDVLPNSNYLTEITPRHFSAEGLTKRSSTDNYNVKLLGVEDNVKLVAIGDQMFSARAGEAEEAFRFEFLELENTKTDTATNLLRGSFGPYLGIVGFPETGKLIDIRIPNLHTIPLDDMFKIRYNDKSSFEAISDRIALKDIEDFFEYNPNDNDIKKPVSLKTPLYRGDCYICQVTHRFNRNFQDPSAPTNDKIVDSKCWKDNFEYTDGVLNVEKFDKINLGDVNAVQLGMWVTFTVRSTKNLNIRNFDDSIVDEVSMFGHPRTYFPNGPMSTEGVYKIPEAACYNKGFEVSLSERWNYEAPDVPAIKNDFTNRIAYSDVHVNDAFKNGFRVFLGTHYRDYPKTYGSIIKLIELQGNLLCVFEHGIALIPVNERAVAGEGSGGNIYINTSNVLPENPKIISDTFGSQWRDSVIKTPRGVYGVDTIGKKIWRTNGQEFECISDFRILEFLNQNISLTERELEPVIGVRNVKTHYNKFKGDVMFTFYDNLYGFEEKVWNICFNENLLKWITFYSWVPSYSENIYNQYFSFDRNTSKWITKLGVSKYENDFSDGITLDNVIIEDDDWQADLHLSNRNLPTGTGIVSTIEYELVRDNYRNDKLFEIKVTYSYLVPSSEEEGKYKRVRSTNSYTISEWETFKKEDAYKNINGLEPIYFLKLKDRVTVRSLESELYERNADGSIKKDDERGIRIYLDKDRQINPDKIVRLLNIRAKIKVAYDNPNGDTSLGEAYASGYNNKTFVDQGYYESVVAVIPKYNILFLTTDFWKHGLAGIIDIADKIAPTYWYGKQHPFEFEFIVADSPDRHKIFDSLEIISNKAAPESFHYEIVGECYDFAKDKKNMYIRQEATKELYQFNGSDIVFNPDYKNLISEHRPLSPGDPNPKHYDKSTIFPLYYYRLDTINEIEDFYHLHGHKDKYGKGDKNFSALAGAEIVRYENLNEYRIWNHAKAVDIKENGLLRGNMYYKEDKWDVQINPINLVLRNESKEEWLGPYGATTQMVPAEYNLFPIPEDIKELGLEKGITLPDDWTRNVISWPDYQKRNKEAKIKDKFIKIRIRYSGEDLAIISAIRTLYSISYA